MLIMSETFFKSVGTLHYDHVPGYGYRLVLNIDKGIGLFYKSLIPKWFKANSQMYEPHITVVRYEKPKNLAVWGKYEGERVEFTYSNYIFQGKVYWFLDCFSKRLEEIREELGLHNAPLSPDYHDPIEGLQKVFHTTIANMKEIKQAERRKGKR
jgi:hypothetical protein